MVKNLIVAGVLVAVVILLKLKFYSNFKLNNDGSAALFLELDNADWKETFFDTGTGDWKKSWHLDGLKAQINNTSKGMNFMAGPIYGDDSCHTVLWTKQSFEGDVRIEYEYTKLDTFTRAVTIIYLLATGCEEGPYKKDIFMWNNLRVKPSMRSYFDNMNTYHISYAAFPANSEGPEDDYIRARRYMPLAKKGLTDTDLKPDYFRTGLFKTGIPHKITIIAKGNDLFMNIRNDEKELLCHWNTSSHPPVTEGRIGLRHMFTRAARYSNFRVSILESNPK